MLGKSCVFLFVSLYLNYAFGQFGYPSVFTSWTSKSEKEKMFTDNQELEINKLDEKIEERLEQRGKQEEKLFTDKLALELNKLKDEFEEKLKQNSEKRGKQEEKKFTDKLALELSKLKEEFEEKLKQNSEKRGKQEEKKFTDKLALELNKLEKEYENRLEQNLENILADKQEEIMYINNVTLEFNQLKKTVEERLEQNSENKLEEKLARKLIELEEKLEKKIEDEFEKNMSVVTTTLEINQLKKKVEERLEQNPENRLEEKLPRKLKELEVKHEKNFEDELEQKHNVPQKAEWVSTTVENASSLSGRAVVGGYDSNGSSLWVIRAPFHGDLVSGKFIVHSQSAFVPYGFKEHEVKNDIEVYCAPPEKVHWVESSNGVVPPNAVVAGNTANGETLYVGRAQEKGLWIPGKIHPKYRAAYIPYFGEEIKRYTYEVLCLQAKIEKTLLQEILGSL